jgi:hypothetical protein
MRRTRSSREQREYKAAVSHPVIRMNFYFSHHAASARRSLRQTRQNLRCGRSLAPWRVRHLTASPQVPAAALSSTKTLLNTALFLEVDAGRITPRRYRSISAEMSAATDARTWRREAARVRIIELQWDMQTGNFMEESLNMIVSSTARVSGQPNCLSALVASGRRCLQVFTPAAPECHGRSKPFADSLQVHSFAVSDAHVQLICNIVYFIICAIAARHHRSFQIIH